MIKPHIRFLLLSAIPSILFLSACSKRPEGVLSDDEMVSLLTDMQLAEAYVNVSHISSVDGDALTESVLKAHGVSREELDSTLKWYGKNIDTYNELFAKVDKNIDRKRRSIINDSGEAQEESSGNLWPYPYQMMISPLGNTDVLMFSIPAEDFSKGDVVNWRMRLNSDNEVSVSLGVDYSDGSGTQVIRTLSGTRRIDMKVQSDSSKTVKRIFGVMRPRKTGAVPVWADSISLTLAPLDTTRYYYFHSQHSLRKLLPKERGKVSDSLKLVEDRVEESIRDIKTRLDNEKKHPGPESGNNQRRRTK